MSLYRLVSSKTLHTNEEIAEYLDDDLDFLQDVCQKMGFSTGQTIEKGRSAAQKLRSGQELDEDKARILAAIYYGDAEWQGPWCSWIKNPALRKLGMLSEGLVREKWMEIAENFYDIEKLDRPRYTRPSFYEINGSICIQQADTKENAIMMKTGILHLDWVEYVSNQTGIDHDAALFEKAREETASFYAGELEDFSDDVRKLQHHMFRNDRAWFDHIRQDLGVRAYTIRRAENIYRKHLEDEISLKQV